MALDLILGYRTSQGINQQLHAGDPRADETITLLVSEDPTGLHQAAAVQINRDEAQLLVDHLRRAFLLER
jgi:hypothetical protein